MTIHRRYIDQIIPPVNWYQPEEDAENLQAQFKFANLQAFYKASWRNKLLFINRWFWIALGKVLAFLYAQGSALTIAAAAILFGCGLTGVLWPGIIAGVVMYFSGLLFNFKITWRSTPKVLLDFFGRGRLFKGLTEYYDKYGNRKYLSPTRLKWLKFGVVCAIASGLTWSAIGFSEIISALSIVFSFSAAAAPPVAVAITAIIMAGLFVSTVAILTKEIAIMLRNENIFSRIQGYGQQCWSVLSGKYFKLRFEECKQLHPDDSFAAKKQWVKSIAKDTGYLLVSVVIVGMAVTGVIMMMKTGAESLANFLVENVKVGSVIAQAIASINCFFLAFSGELPFALSTGSAAAKSVQKKMKGVKPAKAVQSLEQSEQASPTSLKSISKATWPYIHVGNAIGNGFIAMKTFMGNLLNKCHEFMDHSATPNTLPDPAMMTFSVISGFITSYTAGFHDDDEANEHLTGKTAAESHQSSLLERFDIASARAKYKPSAFGRHRANGTTATTAMTERSPLLNTANGAAASFSHRHAPLR